MLLTISGPSTVGKDRTWTRLAEDLGYAREVPYTTREMRSGEQPGRDHHYLSVASFHARIREGRLAEWDYVLGNYYGTDISLEGKISRGENVVLQVLGRMALRLKRRYTHVCTLMLLTSDRQTLEARLSARGYTGDELAARIAHGREEFAHAPVFDYVVPDADIMTDIEVTRVLNDFLATDNR